MRVPYKLPSKTFAASGDDSILLRDLPTVVFGLIAHVAKFAFSLVYTPTTTALPTTVGNNAVVKQLDLYDGKITRFKGGFNHMRAKERMHTGRNRVPDADTDTASASARYVRRVLHMGAPNFAKPEDFVVPCGVFTNGQFNLKWGALLDLAADCTAATGTLRSVAWLELLREIRIPPIYEWGSSAVAAKEATLAGRAAYDVIAVLNSDSFDAIAAGDFGSITVDTGKGYAVPGVPGYDLTHAMKDDFGVGEIGGFAGEPEGTPDDNGKIVNHGTPTAIVAESNDLQAVLWGRPGQKISKLEHTVAEASLKYSHDGTQTTGTVLFGRILPQDETVAASYGALASQAIKRTGKQMVVKTLSKKPYTGNMQDFMPWKIAV